MRVCRRTNPASDRCRLLLGLWAVALLSLGLACRHAYGEIRVLVDRPPAVEGAPFLVPVRVSGDEPSAVPLRIEVEGGTPIEWTGRLLWPTRPASSAADLARWACASNELRLAADRPAGATDAYLAVELPVELPPELRSAPVIALAGATISPAWLAAAPVDLLERLKPRVSAVVPQHAPDPLLSRPDPDAPFERFRFALGSALRGWDEPAALDPASPDGLAARATTALWLAAIARVEQASTATAAELVEALVATCSDDTAPAPIAAWIADPAELATVLSLAIGLERDGAALAEAVASWLRVRSPLLVWIEDETVDAVSLAFANPTDTEEVVRLYWLDSAWLDEHEAPIAALVPPVSVARVKLARPTRAPDDDGKRAQSDADNRDVLRIEHRGQARAVTMSARTLPAEAAGPVIAGFQRPLSLVAAATGASLAAPEGLVTIASLRPRLEGWELFAEVRCPDGPTAADSLVVVGVGGARVTVRGDGSVDDPDGVLVGTTVEVKSYPDRYRMGFQVPARWISRVDGKALVELGLRRTGTQGSADAPFASAPWRRLPRTVAFDLLAR